MPDEVIVKRAHRGGRGKDKNKRAMSQNSLKNLRPAKPGEVKNANGISKDRLYTDKYELTGESITPDHIRLILNVKLHLQLKAIRDAARAAELPKVLIDAIEKEMKREVI